MVNAKPAIQKEEVAPAAEDSVQVTKKQDVYQQYYELLSSSLEEATTHLASVLDLPDYESNPRSAARLDFISYALQTGRRAQHALSNGGLDEPVHTCKFERPRRCDAEHLPRGLCLPCMTSGLPKKLAMGLGE
eukprot:1154648-Pelagomonas_calceolata.AAC.6